MPLGPRPRAVPVRAAARCARSSSTPTAPCARWLDAAARARWRTIAVRGTYLDREDVERFLGLSLPGVDELIGLLELARLGARRRHDEVVVGHRAHRPHPAPAADAGDAAPDRRRARRHAGQAPVPRRAAWAGRTARDAADALIDGARAEAAAILGRCCAIPRATAFSWVLLPEALSLAEAARRRRRPRGGGHHRAARSWSTASRRRRPGPCALCEGRRRAEAPVIAAARARVRADPRCASSPALDDEPRGRRRPARGSARRCSDAPVGAGHAGRARARGAPAHAGAGARRGVRRALVAAGARASRARACSLFGGKGGVGKTRPPPRPRSRSPRARPPARAAPVRRPRAFARPTRWTCRSATTSAAVPGAPPACARASWTPTARSPPRRERYRSAVEQLFDALRGGSSLDRAYDRAVVQDLIELAPPGHRRAVRAGRGDGGARARRGRRARRRGPRHRAHRPRAAAARPARRRARLGRRRCWPCSSSTARWCGLGELAAGARRRCRASSGALAALLRDPARTAFVAVTRPGRAAAARDRAAARRARARCASRCAGLLVNALTPPGLRALPARRRPRREGRGRGSARRSAAGAGGADGPCSAGRSAAARGARAAGLGQPVDNGGRCASPPRAARRAAPPRVGAAAAKAATYVYCLVAAAAAAEPGRARGARRARARCGCVGAGDGLWLVAADAPLPAYAARRHRTRAEGPGLGGRARGGARAAWSSTSPRRGTVVPMKLFTLFATDARAAGRRRRGRRGLRAAAAPPRRPRRSGACACAWTPAACARRAAREGAPAAAGLSRGHALPDPKRRAGASAR